MINDTQHTANQSSHPLLYSLLLPLLVLAVTLTTTILMWHNIDQRISKRAQTRFQNHSDDILRQLLSRLQNNETVLLGGNSLFEVRGESLTRLEWHIYASSLNLTKTNPGILGFGYTVWLKPDQVPMLEQEIRQEGFPQFHVTPEESRDIYTAIVWLEPFNKANQRAFGYDMYSEPVRRAAMDIARDTGKTSITGKVILVQEMNVIKQNGILMYIPSYRAGMPLSTVEERRTALRGYVYSPIRMDDFAYGALKIMPQDIDFSIYAGNKPDTKQLLFSSWQAERRSPQVDYPSKFERTTTIEVYGTTWCLTFRSLPEFDNGFDQHQPQILLVAGILMSIGLSLLAFMQGRARHQALIIADQMHDKLLTQQKFALYFQQSPLAVIEWNTHEIITAWNPAAGQVFGYNAEEAIGQNLSLLQATHQENGKSVQANLTKSGNLIDCEWYSTPLTSPDNQVRGMVALVKDITERKKLEQALQASETQFRLLFEEHSAIMLLLDPQTGRIIKANHAASEFYGYSREQLEKMDIGQISCLPQDNIEQILSQIDRGELSEFAVPHRIADGSVRTVEMHTASISIQDSSVNFAIVHDITSRIQADEERERLETQNIQLQKAESLARMAGAIAHHFNNKLQAVTMSLEMMGEVLYHSPEHKEKSQMQDLADSALKSAASAAEVSKLLLIYLGSAPCQFSLLDLRVICTNYQPILKATIPESIDYSFQATELRLMINANANNIQQVLTNLVANAWEACPNHQGEVALCIDTIEGAAIPNENRFPVDFTPEDVSYAMLEVRDTGVGIREQDIARLFDPFYSSKFTGRGMGLSAVLGIIRAHKGAVTVETGEGQGSAFTVYFPLLQLNIVENPKQEQQKEHPSQGGTILVVDDEEIIRKIVGEMLERLGYKILEAANGAQAVEIFNEHQARIDCILCDVVMPRLNGWETVAIIRKKAPDIPVILASGYNESHVMVGHNELAIQAFLEKPFLFSKLKEVLAKLL
nr:CHASE domain-containing protein [uncultured Desulfobulbus sp.]